MTKTISVTLPAELFQRLEAAKKARGGERSKIVQRALAYYLDLEGPDPKVVKRWNDAYARVAEEEAQQAEKWRDTQVKALGQP